MSERLQKIIAAAGIASRRKAEELIVQGRVTVNGRVVSELGSKADPTRDHIRVNGKRVQVPQRRIYLLLNKPVGYVSTVRDPQGRPTVMSLLRGIKERVYPVGRLDYHSSGLLILTNDGELANALMSRRSAIPRTYHVKLEGHPAPEDLRRLEQGIPLDGRRTAPARLRALAGPPRGTLAVPGRAARRPQPVVASHRPPKPWYELTLVEGRYHQVRRMFERIGQRVIKLKRVRIAFLTDQGLKPGQYRALTPAEVERLRTWRAGRAQ
jgi:23S rRNA pseudouridine2605 synthase